MQVTVLQRSPYILSRLDHDISIEAQRVLESEGIRFINSAEVVRFEMHEGLKSCVVRTPAGTRRISAEEVLCALGRRPAVETLAVVAYHQPVTRAEIEEIRGVSVSRGTLDVLIETGWIRSGRRRRTPGRPMTWITTPAFLEHFGLANLPKCSDISFFDKKSKRRVIRSPGKRPEVIRTFYHEMREINVNESERNPGLPDDGYP